MTIYFIGYIAAFLVSLIDARQGVLADEHEFVRIDVLLLLVFSLLSWVTFCMAICSIIKRSSKYGRLARIVKWLSKPLFKKRP